MRRPGRVWKVSIAALVALTVSVLLSEVSAQPPLRLAEHLLEILDNTEAIKAEMLTDVTTYFIKPDLFGTGNNMIECVPDRDVLLHAVVAPFLPDLDGTVEIGQTVQNAGFTYSLNITDPIELTYGVEAGKLFRLEVTGTIAVISIQSAQGADLGCILE